MANRCVAMGLNGSDSSTSYLAFSPGEFSSSRKIG